MGDFEGDIISAIPKYGHSVLFYQIKRGIPLKIAKIMPRKFYLTYVIFFLNIDCNWLEACQPPRNTDPLFQKPLPHLTRQILNRQINLSQQGNVFRVPGPSIGVSPSET